MTALESAHEAEAVASYHAARGDCLASSAASDTVRCEDRVLAAGWAAGWASRKARCRQDVRGVLTFFLGQ